MPTLIENRTLEESVVLCRELKLDFVEINMNLPQYQLPRINALEFERIGKEYEIFYTIHLDENLDISDFNPYIAQGYLRTVAETIALAKRLEIPVLNMHLSRGVYFTLPDQKVFLFDRYSQEYLKSIESFRKLCEKEIGTSGIKICIENCSGFTEFQKKALHILLQSPVFGLTFDIGHDHSSGNVDKPLIIENEGRLCHMHMHDAVEKKNHLPLGTGEIDLGACLALAEKHNCRVVLETKTIEGLKQSVKWLRATKATSKPVF